MLLLAALACRKSPEAPAEISELTRYLAREVQDEDIEVLAAGVEQLDAHLATIDMEGDIVDERSWIVDVLTEDDVALYEHPDRSLDVLVTLGVVGEELHAIEDHAPYMMWVDQTNINAGVVYYTRTFPDTEDGSCFAEGSCESILTFNHSIRENALYEVYLEVYKYWRWVELDDGRRAVVAFAWFEESWPTTNGKEAHLWQNFELDVWMDHPTDEKIWRYYVSWTENDVAESADIVQGMIRGTTESRYETEEAAAGGEITE
ncbi:MAG TPA: hypothetical protein QGF58_03810 [Myxococcota bacterium]|nr:hypothetical protein [Myxococcota bacterium]